MDDIHWKFDYSLSIECGNVPNPFVSPQKGHLSRFNNWSVLLSTKMYRFIIFCWGFVSKLVPPIDSQTTSLFFVPTFFCINFPPTVCWTRKTKLRQKKGEIASSQFLFLFNFESEESFAPPRTTPRGSMSQLSTIPNTQIFHTQKSCCCWVQPLVEFFEFWHTREQLLDFFVKGTRNNSVLDQNTTLDFFLTCQLDENKVCLRLNTFWSVVAIN